MDPHRNCHLCKHCGPANGDRMRCDHPSWDEVEEPEDSVMRQMHADFGEVCSDFDRNSLTQARA